MPTLTLPEKIKKGEDLVAIPRKEYEELLRVQTSSSRPVKIFKPTVGEKKAIEAARRRFSKGEHFTLEELRHELALNR